MFIVTDVLVFASLFAVYAVFRARTAGGPSPAEVFRAPGPVVLETLLLLTSSFTVSLALWAMRRGALTALALWLVTTVLLGGGFVGLELQEFTADALHGAAWSQNAFLSSFFLLVGAHGMHVSFGLLWALGLLAQLARRGLRGSTARKVFSFALYWHFLDIVWVFIFTFVYLATWIG